MQGAGKSLLEQRRTKVAVVVFEAAARMVLLGAQTSAIRTIAGAATFNILISSFFLSV